ncbi:MAG: hypothetical protein J5379_06615 [Clostridiales bacterium]|nr:hypothetical protein [Clostridiales bacterium]
MTSILEQLLSPQTWQEFLEYKLTHHYLSRREKEQLSAYIGQQRYLPIARALARREYCLDLPLRRTINKSGSTKKRIVYTFSEDENLYLKCLAFQLYRYDGKLSPRCYSFRRTRSARDAIYDILAQKDRDSLYCFKADISNYFNSIPEKSLTGVLEELIDDDPDLLWFLRELLLCGQSRLPDGSIVTEHRGAMAGIPVSPFFANVYLLSMDRHFEDLGASYFRYSDDILIFAHSQEELDALISDFYRITKEHGLSINPAKVSISLPGESWEFLGFSYRDGQVDISRVTQEKLKGKIRRKARALLRWKTRTGASYERAARALIRTFNKKLYNEQSEDLFTWSRWFFPVITTDKSLHELDMYLLEYVRYLDKGRHYKGNYRIIYDQIKEMGYKSLRHEYYISREFSETTRTDGEPQ